MSAKKKKPEPVDRAIPTIADRLSYILVDAFVDDLSDAISDAQVLAGSLHPDEMEPRRQELEALRQTVFHLFGRTLS